MERFGGGGTERERQIDVTLSPDLYTRATFLSTSLGVTVEEVLRRGILLMDTATNVANGSIPEMDADQAEYQPRIHEALARIDQLRKETQAQQPKVDALKAETRAILAQLQGA